MTGYKRFIAAMGLLAALAMGGCEKKEAAPAERPPSLVQAVTAVSKDVPVFLDEIGRCVAREYVSIQPQVTGKITAIHFEDGATLKPGDPLFTIDPRPYQAQLNQVEAGVAQAKAAADLAKVEFARMEALLNTKAISKQDYDTKKGAMNVADAQVKSAEAALETAKLNLEYCEIKAPIQGRAGQRLIDVGNVVTANNNTSLMTIQRLDPIYADFTVTENDMSAVQQNAKQGTLKVEVRIPDDPDHPATGDLTFMDNLVQEASGTLKLRATLANPDLRFWPGRFVKARLILATQKDAVLIPAVAPQVSAQGKFVYVVGPDSTAEMRIITPGQRHGDLLVVTGGVKAGDRVITLGQFALMPGAKVRVEEPKAPAPPPNGAAAPATKPAEEKKADEGSRK
jgi:multidrug efflux system membrane fusion protein